MLSIYITLFIRVYCVYFDFVSFQYGRYRKQKLFNIISLRKLCTYTRKSTHHPVDSSVTSPQEKLIIFVTHTQIYITTLFEVVWCYQICCLIRNFGNVCLYLYRCGIEAKTLLTLSDLMIPFRINKLFQLDKLALAYFSESILHTHTHTPWQIKKSRILITATTSLLSIGNLV